MSGEGEGSKVANSAGIGVEVLLCDNEAVGSGTATGAQAATSPTTKIIHVTIHERPKYLYSPP
jgi:hypothetical protein